MSTPGEEEAAQPQEVIDENVVLEEDNGEHVPQFVRNDPPEAYDLGDGTFLTYFKEELDGKVSSVLRQYPLTVTSKDKKCLQVTVEVHEEMISGDDPNPFVMTVMNTESSYAINSSFLNLLPDCRHTRGIFPPRMFRVCVDPKARQVFVADLINDTLISSCPFPDLELYPADVFSPAALSASGSPPTSETPPLNASTADSPEGTARGSTPTPTTEPVRQRMPRSSALNGADEATKTYQLVMEHRGDGWVRFFDPELTLESFSGFPMRFDP